MSQFEELTTPISTSIELKNPFPGLRPFNIEESHLFFGREGQTDEVLLKLSKNRFVGIVGPSGSGKSSFVYCGVLPILYGGFLTEVSSEWEVLVIKPGADPINNLAESIIKSSDGYDTISSEDRKIKKTIISTLLRSSSLELVEALRQFKKATNTNYLILVDQFEEVFWAKKDDTSSTLNETRTFINLLIEASNYEDLPIYVAITMRSDFIGDCSHFPELAHKLNESHYLIPQMTREQKRKAIEGPLAVSNTPIAPQLINQLLNDLGENPDQLPILQHAMMRTWAYWIKYRNQEHEALDLKHYRAIGSMAEALSLHADEAFDELSEEQKRICEIIFKTITEKRDEGFGIRKPTQLSKIAAIADTAEQDVIDVIDKFRDPSRSLLVPSHRIPIHSESLIDISHESLMRIWVRLKQWVDDEADAAQMYLRLAEAASMYQQGKAGLWRTPDLQVALNWQAKHKPTLVWGERYHHAFERTMVFLEYSQKEFETEQRTKELEQKKKLQRSRITAIVFGSLMIVALLFLVYAIFQQTEAKKQEKLARNSTAEAEKQRDQATIAKEDALSQKHVAEQQKKLADLARQEAEHNALEAERQRRFAEKQQKLALENEQRAKANEKLAKNYADDANQQRLTAEQNEANARRARYIAQSKAMALKSQELTSNPELEALLAQQAYNFNTEFQGYPYDNDVYNGLFYALKNYQHPLTSSLKSQSIGSVRALRSHPNNKSIYSGGTDGIITQWNYQNGQWVANLIVNERTDYLIFTLNISPDGSRLAAGGLYPSNREQNYVELYNLNNIEGKAQKIEGYISDVGDLLFTPDGKGFYCRDNSGHSIRYYQFNWNDQRAKEVISTEVKITCLEISSDGSQLVAGATDGAIYTWDINNNYAETKTKVSDQILSAVTFDPTGEKLLVGDYTGLIRIISNGVTIRELSGHTKKIETIQFNHAGTFIASSSKDSRVRLWNYNNLKEPPITLSHHDWTWDVAFSSDDEQLMVGINTSKETVEDTEYSVRVWPTKSTSMSGILCNLMTKNLTQEEWDIFIGEDLFYRATCKNLPVNEK